MEKVEYRHAEAFCHMQYGCPKGHITWIWNSRDGVTPFMELCRRPGCEEIAQHVHWREDRQEPGYQLQPGDWYFRDGTREEAIGYLHERFDGKPVDVDWLAGTGCKDIEEAIMRMANDPHGGFAPGWPMLDQYQG